MQGARITRTPGPKLGRQGGEQGFGAHHRARQAVANPDRQGRRRRLVLHDDVEMGVERGDLIHLGHRQAHLGGKRREMACVQAPVMVLQEMQVLDQKVALPRAVAEKRPHLVLRARVDLTALRKLARPAASGAGVNAARRLARHSVCRRGDDECS